MISTTFNWYHFFSNPIVLSILSSGIILAGITFLLKSVFKLGETNLNFKHAIADIRSLKTGMETIEHCIIEIQTILKSKYTNLEFSHTINKYGIAHSPIVLRNELREFITKPKLDIQIKAKNKDLLEWLNNKHPETGLDAQDYLIEFVFSGEISKYLDLVSYKQYLYEKGKTSEDANGILGVYLFEILIPQLALPDNEK